MKDVDEPETSETSSCPSEKESANQRQWHQRSPSPPSSKASDSDYENDYDFSKASNPSSVVRMEQQPKVKNFYILNPKDQGLVPIQIEKDDA